MICPEKVGVFVRAIFGKQLLKMGLGMILFGPTKVEVMKKFGRSIPYTRLEFTLHKWVFRHILNKNC